MCYLCTPIERQAVENNAKVAQLVERNLAKVEVASSNLVFRSSKASLTDAFYLEKSLPETKAGGKDSG